MKNIIKNNYIINKIDKNIKYYNRYNQISKADIQK